MFLLYTLGGGVVVFLAEIAKKPYKIRMGGGVKS